LDRYPIVRPSGRLVLALSVVLPAGGGRLAHGDVTLPALFGSHMVLQQGREDRVWGRADPGEEITVRIADQIRTTEAGADGKWSVTLGALKAGGPFTMTVEGTNVVTIDDVLVGEVWLCAGQSNMQWAVREAADGDLEALAAHFPRIRLITVPHFGTQEPRDDFEGRWESCTPETVREFSAVGFFFGRQLHQALDVPIGLVDVAWGGSACEAWIRRDLLESDERFRPLIERWRKLEEEHPQALAKHEEDLAGWKAAAAKAQAEGKQPPGPPESPEGLMQGNARPGNIYNGVLAPTIGYGLRGVIWYQGEANTGRAYQYRDLFPLMIRSWRQEWGLGEFPFYWVQLADYKDETPEPAQSDWAELREAQTLTMSTLPNTGQAVIIDLGEGNDIHPRNKQGVARRLVRWALARDYGIDVPYRSPVYRAMERRCDKVVVTFDHVGGGLKAIDVAEPRGFAVAACDRRFVRARARIVDQDTVEVWSDEVSDPVAVRYAWADNPACNLSSREGLPVTPFRTDDWPGVTADAK
jgi:sialate O-acetylesterase